MITINEDTLFATIIQGSLALLVTMMIIGFVFFSRKTGLGILAGGSVAIINFFWIRNVLQRILGLQPARPALYSQMRFIARLTLMGVVLYFLITSGWFSLAGLLVGLSVIVVNIFAISLYSAVRAGG
jgi:hypothetical protein